MLINYAKHSIEINLNEVPEALKTRILEKAIRNKIIRYAAEADVLGRSIDEALAVAKDFILRGYWRFVSAESRHGPVPLLAQAIANIKGLPIDVVMSRLDEATNDQIAEWKSHPAIKAEIARLRMERYAQKAQKGFDF